MHVDIDPTIAVAIIACLFFYLYGLNVLKSADKNGYDHFSAGLNGLGLGAFWKFAKKPKCKRRKKKQEAPAKTDQQQDTPPAPAGEEPVQSPE